MEFHQLAYFVAAAETSSISAAARREHVSQPAISRQIARLETQLGAPLFERRQQRIHLTDAGRWLLPRARQLLCDAETAVQQLRERFGGARRTLRLGFIGPFLDDLIAPSVRALRQRQPRVKLSLFDLPPRAQLDRLAASELDAAVLANLGADDRQRFTVRPLSRHRMALALPESHALAGSRSLDLAALRSEDWVSLADTFFPGRREFLLAACARRGFEPRIVSEVDSVALMLGAVSAGDGVALVPQHAQKLPHAGCVFVKVAAPVPVAELLLVTQRRPASPELASLAEILLQQARALSEP